jgi:hypothetical protein
MTHHVLDELRFDAPEGFQVVGVLRKPMERADTYGANMVITRDRLRQAETLSTYIDRQLVDLAKKLKRFVIRGRTDCSVGGTPAHEIQCTWQGAQGVIEQFLTVVPRGGGVITFTASALKAEGSTILPMFREVLRGLCFVEGSAGGDENSTPGV